MLAFAVSFRPSSLLASPRPAPAIVGGAAAAPDSIARAVVLIVGSRGNFCSGAAIARDLVLTAAHCVLPGADYKIVEFEGREPQLRGVASVTAIRNSISPPCWRTARPRTWRCSSSPLRWVASSRRSCTGPASRSRRAIASRLRAPASRRATTAIGRDGTGRPAGRNRATGTLQIRLFDPVTRGEKPGLGACTGDSGAPVFGLAGGRPAIIGVVSWSTGPQIPRVAAASPA